MSSIRIIAVPEGFPPEDIRKQWLGVVIPLPSAEEIAEDPPSDFGFGLDNVGGHMVLRTAAIKALRDAGRDEAVDFWDSFLFSRFLVFKQEVCEVVS